MRRDGAVAIATLAQRRWTGGVSVLMSPCITGAQDAPVPTPYGERQIDAPTET